MRTERSVFVCNTSFDERTICAFFRIFIANNLPASAPTSLRERKTCRQRQRLKSGERETAAANLAEAARAEQREQLKVGGREANIRRVDGRLVDVDHCFSANGQFGRRSQGCRGRSLGGCGRWRRSLRGQRVLNEETRAERCQSPVARCQSPPPSFRQPIVRLAHQLVDLVVAGLRR